MQPQPEPASENSFKDRDSLQKCIEADHVNDFINAMTSGGRAQLLADHDALRKKERHVFYFMRNPAKNRFGNVVLYNEGAVVLERQNKDESNYIHATKLRSKYGMFIMAQAPLKETLFEWYRMIWQYNVRVVVCLNSLENKNKDDCYKYFERKVGKKVKSKRFTAKTFAIRPENCVTTYELRLSNSSAKSEDRERTIHVVHFPDWSIYKYPDARHLLQLLRAVWALEQSLASVSDARECPTLVHGCSGTRRTGAYVIMSMLCKQLRERGVVSVIAACSTVRKYRYGVMRNRLNFATVLEVILYFATELGMVDRQNRNFHTAIKRIKSAFPLPADKASSADAPDDDEKE
uniref:Protein tyrosine phosphatase n=1 Tax=Panagrolaimus sp. JU765 TaxID=591449 RepID=A0AC34RQY1_9BILA